MTDIVFFLQKVQYPISCACDSLKNERIYILLLLFLIVCVVIISLVSSMQMVTMPGLSDKLVKRGTWAVHALRLPTRVVPMARAWVFALQHSSETGVFALRDSRHQEAWPTALPRELCSRSSREHRSTVIVITFLNNSMLLVLDFIIKLFLQNIHVRASQINSIPLTWVKKKSSSENRIIQMSSI